MHTYLEQSNAIKKRKKEKEEKKEEEKIYEEDKREDVIGDSIKEKIHETDFKDYEI